MSSPPQFRSPPGLGLDAQLDRWVRAQLIAPEQARRIADYESGMRPPAAATGVGKPERKTLSPWAETAAYVGGGITCAAGLALAALTWDALPEPVRLLALAITAAVLLVAGWWVGADTGPARRLSSLLWFLGTGATTASATLLAFDLFTEDPRALTAIVGVVSLVVGIPLWLLRRTTLQAASVWLSSQVLLASVVWDSSGEVLGPVAFFVLGMAWMAAAVVGLVRPLGACGVLGGFTAFGAAVALSGEQTAVGLVAETLVVGVGLWAGREHDRWVLTGASVLGLLILIPQTLYQVFGDDPVGATMATLLVGLVVTVLAIVRLNRRRERDADVDAGAGARWSTQRGPLTAAAKGADDV